MCVVHNESHEVEYDYGDAKHVVVFALTVSVLIFFVVDGNFFYNSIVDVEEVYWNMDRVESHPEAVRIEVNVCQWVWEVCYVGVDGEFGILYVPSSDDVVVLNDIRVFVGVFVILELGVVDVIHFFYLPNFRAKIDVVLGVINKFWF